MTQIIGHFHPLLVHLPIGILLLAFLLECMARWFQQHQLRPAIRVALFLGLSASLLSALTGWLLAENADYDQLLLQRHRWFGAGTVGMFALVWLKNSSKWYFSLFCIGVLALLITGHYGGSLTHGEHYLFQKENAVLETAVPTTPSVQANTPIFAGIIEPILQKKCVACHRAEKSKGNLILNTEEGLLMGGKHGKLFVPGNPDSSNLLRRIMLPHQDDQHMPPSGKPPLTAIEIKLIEWWIASGADFNSMTKDHPIPQELSAAMRESTVAPNPVFSLPCDFATAVALKNLEQRHIKVQSMGQGVPWLIVSLAGQQYLTTPLWQALEAISTQLVDLDLSHTAVQDRELTANSFPHLTRLNLSHTKIGNGALPWIEKSPYLECINLTNTAIGNELQTILAKLPHLKKLFLWQTNITPEAISAWKQQFPNLTIETGQEITNEDPLVLPIPKILYARSFFDDTMHLELSFPFKGVSIYYTLDETAKPSNQSTLYQEKIILTQTSHLRAFAGKQGWQDSPLAEAVFVKKKFTIAGATMDRPPSPKYPAKGAASLIDGQISDAQGADSWLGLEGDHLDATLDLGQMRDIGKVYVHCLENNSPWIFRPTAISVQTSIDGKTYKPQAKEFFSPNTSMGEQRVHLLGCIFKQNTTARFLKVHIESPLKNPSWHPGKGQKCWIFVDEITVE